VGKKDEDKIGELVEELIADVGNDRERLSDFLDRLLSEDHQSAGIAEYVAKIAAELTRQNQVKVATIKALGKSIPQDGPEDDSEITDEIGRPFPEEIDEGSN
jgi:hypothetical protein